MPLQRGDDEVDAPERTRRSSLVQRVRSLLVSLSRQRPRNTQRPVTAPVARNHHAHMGPSLPTRDQTENDPSPPVQSAIESDMPCPYDPTHFQSFPSIEGTNCWSCTVLAIWTRDENVEQALTPCSACRTRSPFSHLVTGSKYFVGSSTTSILGSVFTTSESRLNRSMQQDPGRPRTFEDRPRPRQILHLPDFPALPTLPSRISSNTRPPARHATETSEQSSAFERVRGIFFPTSSTTSLPSRPESPKLHHIHGLPNARDCPYVHRREVRQHLEAIRAGAPSPVLELQREAESTSSGSDTSGSPDWLDTVYYRGGRSPVPARPRSPTLDRAHSRNRNTHRLTNGVASSHLSRTDRPPPLSVHARAPNRPALPGNSILSANQQSETILTNDVATSSVEFEPQASRIYALRSPARAHSTPSPSSPLRNEIRGSSSSDESTFSTGTMPPIPAEIGGTRLELRGGRACPFLRGGGAEEKRFRCGGTWCRKPKVNPNFMIQPHMITTERAVRTLGYVGRARLPPRFRVHCLEGCYKCYHQHTSMYWNSSIARSTTLGYQAPDFFSQSRNNVPRLRGGGCDNQDGHRRVPPTLWFLAGGQGRPITMSSWNKQKPRRRMDGLMGMILYGRNAGMPYEPGLKKTSASKTGGSSLKNEGASGGAPDTKGKRKVHFDVPSSGASSSSSNMPDKYEHSEMNSQDAVPRPDNPGATSDSGVPKDNSSGADSTSYESDARCSSSAAENSTGGATPGSPAPDPTKNSAKTELDASKDGAPGDGDTTAQDPPPNNNKSKDPPPAPGGEDTNNDITASNLENPTPGPPVYDSKTTPSDPVSSGDSALPLDTPADTKADGGSTAPAEPNNRGAGPSDAASTPAEKAAQQEKSVPGYKRGRRKRTSTSAGGEGNGKENIGDGDGDTGDQAK